MLAAAAGAALVASGTTVVRLSEPAFAGEDLAAARIEPRPGLVPDVAAADAPATPRTPPAPRTVPEPVTAPQIAPPAVDPVERVRRSAPAERSAPAPAELPAAQRSARQPTVEQPAARQPAAERPAAERPEVEEPTVREPSAAEPAAAGPPSVAPAPTLADDPPVRRGTDEREVADGPASSRDASDGDPRDRPSLLGGLTEPLGVSCGGLLRTVCG